MFGAFGQFAAAVQFYLYGKRHCTQTGWERHSANYKQPDLLTTDLNLAGRVFMITGANSGVGKEIARFLSSKGASVYMLCRNSERAEAARRELEITSRGSLHVLLVDLGDETSVRKAWTSFEERQKAAGGAPRLDALVCNGGVLLNEKTMTKDGSHEVTFATHLLFGTYLLGLLAMPTLEATPDARLVTVSSGGMYNVPWPDWPTATSTGKAKYSGQLAYAYAKRGQVLLMERWAEEHPKVKCVTCHPGWTDTPAVSEAYGSQKKYLEPLRTPWQGSEGIIWLCVADGGELQSGAFYLDREPQVKHLAGPFFTKGGYTRNTPAQVDDMLRLLSESLSDRATGDKATGA